MDSSGTETACVYYACQSCTLKFFSREQKYNACPRCGGHVMKTLQDPPWRRSMLVLARKPGEHLVIGDPTTDACIVVTLCEIRREANAVRIGIAAPTSLRILRSEHLASIEDLHPSLFRLIRKDKKQ